MTIHITYEVRCDGYECEAHISRFWSKESAESAAKRAGWRIDPTGDNAYDFCPKCYNDFINKIQRNANKE